MNGIHRRRSPRIHLPVTTVDLCRPLGPAAIFKGNGVYFVFGDGKVTYGARLLRSKPDFDQVVVLSGTPNLNSKYAGPTDGQPLKVGDEFQPLEGTGELEVIREVFFEKVDVNRQVAPRLPPLTAGSCPAAQP